MQTLQVVVHIVIALNGVAVFLMQALHPHEANQQLDSVRRSRPFLAETDKLSWTSI